MPVADAESQPPSVLDEGLPPSADPAALMAIITGCIDGAWCRSVEDDEHEWTSPGLWAMLDLDPPPPPSRVLDRERRMHPEDRQIAQDEFVRLRTRRIKASDQVIRHRHRDGSTLWIRCRAHRVPETDTAPAMIVGTCTDVTPHIRSQAAEARLTEELRALADSIASIVLVVDDRDRIVAANRAASDALHVPVESLVGHALAAVFDRPAATPPSGRRVPCTSAEDGEHQLRILRASDERGRRVFSTRTTELPDNEDGRPRRLLVADDITELSRSRQKLASIFEHLPAAVSAKDPEGRYLVANPFLGRLLEIDPDEMLGRTDMDLLPAETADRLMETDRQVIVTELPASFEMALQLGDRTLTLASIKFPLFDADGSIYATASVAFDVSELQRLQQDLASKNAELERFVFTASHDLKSPLVTILGYLRYLALDLEQGRSDELEDYAARIRGAAEKMHATIDDLLEFSRIGRRRTELALVPLGPVIEELLQDLRPELDAHEATVDVQLEHEHAWCDPTDLRTMLENLMSNALRYGMGAERPRVAITCRRSDDDAVTITVADNGCGIDPAHAERAFELFERLSTERGGTGVGLAIVRRLVGLNRGTVDLVPTPGGGATFRITLSSVPRPTTSAAAAVAAAHGSANSSKPDATECTIDPDP